jgi:hypothetical protein
MMVPKKSLFLAGAALLCLGADTSAQQMKRVSGPLRSVTLDTQTGTLTRGPVVDEKGAFSFNTVSVMNNVSFSGFAGVDTGPGAPAYGPCEWFVALPAYGSGAPDRTGGESQFISALTFIYCSGAQDTLSGGPGGSAIVTFREGYALGTAANSGGPTGTEAVAFTITGLPANTGAGGFFTASPCYYIGVGTPTTVLHDGPMGYSWEFADLGNDGIFAATFPWLACVQSCTGPGPDKTGGMLDFVDQYCPKGTIRSSFTFGTFGGGSNYFTSVSMDIRQAERIDSVNTFFNGTGVNPSVLASTGVGPILGQNWGLSADCTGAAASKFAIFVIGFFNPPPTLTPFGEKLVNTAPGLFTTFVIPHGGGVANLGPFPLPLDLSFYNSCWIAQALCGDSPKGFLTNGFSQTLGSH